MAVILTFIPKQSSKRTVPKDHRKVLDLYYTMTSCYVLSKKHQDMTDNVKKAYQQDEEAEKLQLPCFRPYESNSNYR
jgi:hypothetical protein